MMEEKLWNDKDDWRFLSWTWLDDMNGVSGDNDILFCLRSLGFLHTNYVKNSFWKKKKMLVPIVINSIIYFKEFSENKHSGLLCCVILFIIIINICNNI